MMPSTSKSNLQQSQVEQPPKNWLELPEDVTTYILCRVGVFDILENVQKVCTAWRKICKDPTMWRVIYMDEWPIHMGIDKIHAMCKYVVDRSEGQLINITMEYCDHELLLYVADRSSQLRRLKIQYCNTDIYESWSEALEKFPLLEELNLYWTEISKEAIETIGRYCPMLKILKVNQGTWRFGWDRNPDEESIMNQNKMAIAIGENLHELEHLELVGDIMSNFGLLAILDGCRHLKSLDLRRCLYIDLKGDLGKRCSQQIKCLKLPNDSLEGCPHIYENEMMPFPYSI